MIAPGGFFVENGEDPIPPCNLMGWPQSSALPGTLRVGTCTLNESGRGNEDRPLSMAVSGGQAHMCAW
jgi:hypothetical protein